MIRIVVLLSALVFAAASASSGSPKGSEHPYAHLGACQCQVNYKTEDSGTKAKSLTWHYGSSGVFTFRESHESGEEEASGLRFSFGAIIKPEQAVAKKGDSLIITILVDDMRFERTMEYLATVGVDSLPNQGKRIMEFFTGDAIEGDLEAKMKSASSVSFVLGSEEPFETPAAYVEELKKFIDTPAGAK